MLLLALKRSAVFLLSVILAWVTAFAIFPFADNSLPLFTAVLVTYCFLAYLGLPALNRLSKMIDKPNHVPTRASAGDGWLVDPINLVVLAESERTFIEFMQKAGWDVADNLNFKTLSKEVLAITFNRSYPNAPFGSLFVFGRKQDLGFQIQLGKSPRHRHHVRFWRMGATLLDDEHEHMPFWRKLLKRFVGKKQQVWVGAATLDSGLVIRRRDLQINHGIHSDTSAERDYVVASLDKIGALKDSIKIKAGEALRTSHQGLGETIIADGYVTLCEVKPIKKRS